MIPKIAWFHWEPPRDGKHKEMSWLRKRGIESFRQHNPSWDVRVISTPDDIKARKLHRLPKEGDWSVWRMLRHHGGWLVHSDAIYIKPIPDEWLDYDIAAQVYEKGGYAAWKMMRWGDIQQIPALGIIPNHKFMIEVEDLCASSPDEEYQNYGIQLLAAVVHKEAGGIYRYGNVFNFGREAFCPYYFNKEDVRQLWGAETKPTHPDSSIAVHWYAGIALRSTIDHNFLGEYNAKLGGPSLIERIASEGVE